MAAVAVAGAAAVAAEATLIHLGHSYGSTPTERALALPGDDIVPRPRVVTDHAITIDAPPVAVWPWLVQMGWGRGGWYTARWVDRLLFPANGPSAEHVVPELQDIHLGFFVPDGAPETECGLYVEHLDAPHALVLHSNSHLPKSWRDSGRVAIDWSWAFALRSLDDGARTRFHFRSRWATAPWWLTLGTRLTLVPADFVMARSMLRGVRERAVRTVDTAGEPRDHASGGDAGRGSRPNAASSRARASSPAIAALAPMAPAAR